MSSPPGPMTDHTAGELPELRLKPREEKRLAAGHLWIFSNEVDTVRTPLTAFATGAHCRVVASNDRFLGYAYVNPHALICARILGRDPDFAPGKSLIVHRLQVALASAGLHRRRCRWALPSIPSLIPVRPPRRLHPSRWRR